jgi:arsenite methyltransferase
VASGERSRDRWCEWLLRRRFGGDDEMRQRMVEQLRQIRDRVLDQAEVRESDTLLDVGCGDGLIAFGALERGITRAILSDISEDLLDESRRLAGELGVLDRCDFVCASAEDLSPVKDESVDVVTTRSVLIYVEDKRRAFAEFHRVLRPGGRLSMFEPINRLNRLLRAYPAEGVQELDDRVKGVFEDLQPRDRDPMLDFDDRDLVDLAEAAGFPRVSLTLEMKSEPPEPMPWDTYLDAAWNPNIPTMREVINQVLTPAEQDQYARHFRPLVERGDGNRRMASSYLLASKGDRPAADARSGR